MVEWNHLNLVCMTYFEHMYLSLRLGLLFLRGFVCAIVHALCPYILTKQSTCVSNRVAYLIKHSGCR